MVPVKLNIRIGLDEDARIITKFLLVNRDAKLDEVVQAWAHLPKIMNGVEIQNDFNLLIFSLLENSKG